jgi:hypothetical protein
MALHHTKLRNSASDREISFSNANEQLKKIPVIVNGFTAYSDTFEVTTTEEIKVNNNDIVLINNNINKCKSSAQNILPC